MLVCRTIQPDQLVRALSVMFLFSPWDLLTMLHSPLHCSPGSEKKDNKSMTLILHYWGCIPVHCCLNCSGALHIWLHWLDNLGNLGSNKEMPSDGNGEVLLCTWNFQYDIEMDIGDVYCGIACMKGHMTERDWSVTITIHVHIRDNDIPSISRVLVCKAWCVDRPKVHNVI